MATPPDFTTGQVLTAAQMNAVGLWRITGMTASFTGGTAGSVTDGVVTIGSSNTQIILNNCFNSDFLNYRLVVNNNSNSSSDANMRLQLRTGSTTATTNYYSTIIYAFYTGTTPAAVGVSNGSYWEAVLLSATTYGFRGAIDIFGPNVAQRTSFGSTGASRGDIAGTCNGMHFASTAYESLVITFSAGSITGGTIAMYGYNQ